MNFKLELSINNTLFSSLDLFENQSLNYDAEFYDDKKVTDIKIPFYTDIKIPLNSVNKQFFGYDPLSDDISSFPSGEYFYKILIENQSLTELRGIAKVRSIEYNSDEPYIDLEMKDFLSKFVSEISNIGVADIITDSYYSLTKTISDLYLTTSNGGYAGTVGSQPDPSRIVNFPHIDFCNDIQRLGYEERQFTEYGAGYDRSGIVPTISVPKYLEEIGNFLSLNTSNVTVKSKLFGINETDAIPDFQPSKLQVIIPSKLLCKYSTNTREFTLNQHTSWSGTNQDLTDYKDLDGNDKIVMTNFYGDEETYGNYNTVADTSYQKYGIKNQSNLIEDYFKQSNSVLSFTGKDLGWFCPHMSFKSKLYYKYHPTLTRFRPTGTIKLDIPVIEEDKMVYRVNPSSSSASFNIFIGLYEDGLLKKKVPLNDSNGDKIVLLASNATAVAGESEKYTQTYGHFRRKALDTVNGNGNYEAGAYFNNTLHPSSNRADALQWASVDAYLPSDDELLLEVYGESIYAINYFLEPISGDLNITYADDFETGAGTFGTVWLADSMATSSFDFSSLRKTITHISGSPYFDITIKAIEDFNPYFPDDEYIVKESLNNSSSISPLDLLKVICKRFGCGIFYEYDNAVHVLRIDPLHLLRTQGSALDIDDLKSISILRPSDIIKNLVIKNKSYDSYYDELPNDLVRGDTTQPINNDGISDLEINLESNVYYKSVAGDENYTEYNQNLKLGLVSKNEYGKTDNVFALNEKIGVRFAYILPPNYSSLIKVPYSIDISVRPGLQTTTQRIYKDLYSFPSMTSQPRHTFNGRLSNINPAGFDLLAENNLNNTTDYYDLISSTEQVMSKGSSSIELSCVISTSVLPDIISVLNKKTLSYANNQNILIKSMTGQVFQDYAYLDIKGLIE